MLSFFTRPFLFLTLVQLVCVSGCKQDKKTSMSIPAFDGEKAFAEVEALLKYSPRDAGTSNAWNAAVHISERLKSFEIDTEISSFLDSTPAGQKKFHNVIGRIKGRSNKWIIVASHFDTMPGIDNFQGANDSGSSTGVLIELARMLKGLKLQKGIIFVFFDGEEGIAHYEPGDGLHGSRHFVKELTASGEIKQVQAMILMDMIGDKDLNFSVPYNSDRELVQLLFRAAHETGHRKKFSLKNIIITDDHSPFLDADVPALDIIDFEFGSKPGLNDYWHTSADNLNNITEDSLAITGDIIRKMICYLMNE